MLHNEEKREERHEEEREGGKDGEEEEVNPVFISPPNLDQLLPFKLSCRHVSIHPS